MTKVLQWRFFPLVAGKGSAIGFTEVEIDEFELSILWTLNKNGPKSVYRLQKMEYSLPKRVHKPQLADCPEEHDLLKKTEMPITYHYSFVHKIVRRLEKKKLVGTRSDTFKSRNRIIVEPTFSGLMLYLQNSDDKKRFDYALKHYPKLIPISEQWKSMTNVLGEAKCMRALEQTVDDFIEIQVLRFRVSPLKIDFQGYLESPPEIMRENLEDCEILMERDEKVAKYLETKEGSLLKNSYIAYLIVNDIKTLSRKSREQIGRLLPTLESEKELAYFEKREVGYYPLFKGGRLKEFLPDYANMDYFFIGMFVRNLLWTKKAVPKQEAKEEYDYEIEY